jgi:hypothetical protein
MNSFARQIDDPYAGLSNIWSNDRLLFELQHHTKFAWISKANFWVAAANAGIHQTSVSIVTGLKQYQHKSVNDCSTYE